MRQSLLIIELPSALTTPKFRFWQQVVCYRGEEGLELRGRIVGLWFDGEWGYHIEPDAGDPSARVISHPTAYESFISLQEVL